MRLYFCFRGVVYDGVTMFYIEGPPDRGSSKKKSTSSVNNAIEDIDHYIYSHRDLISNLTCGNYYFGLMFFFINNLKITLSNPILKT